VLKLYLAVLTVLSSGATMLWASPAKAQSGDQANTGSAAKAGAPDQSTTVAGIAVVGSRLDVSPQQSPQEIQIFPQETIRQSGQGTVTDFLNTLPVVSQVVGPSSLEVVSDAQSVRLHGLPLGSTLVLVDGHRVGVSADAAPSNVFDLNDVPLAAVQSIEILPQGSSAVYGSDAIAGVVNITLKKDFDGFAGSVKYGGADHTDETDASAIWGHHWNRGSIEVGASYLGQGQLVGSERPLTADANFTRFGSRDARFAMGNPGNVFGVGGANLPGLNARYAAVPTGYTGTPSIAEFAGTAGTLNHFSLFSDYGLIPAAQREGLLLAGTYEFTPTVELSAQLLYSHGNLQQGLYPNGLLVAQPSFQSYTASAANPFNPFGTKVGIGYVFPGISVLHTTTDYLMPSVDLKADLGRGWTLDFSGTASLDWETRNAGGQVNATALQAALNSSNPATALNVFVAGAPGSAQLINSVLYVARERDSGELATASVLLRGSPVTLPAGALKLSFGGEYDYASQFALNVTTGQGLNTATPTVSRNSYAFYGEALVPVVGPRAGVTGDLFDLTAAGRYDHYSDFGGHWTSQVGGVVRPLSGLTLRTAWSQAFKAPSLYQLFQTQVPFQNPVFDPVLGQPEIVTVTSGGNPHLNPETGESYSFGFAYADGAIPGLDVSVSNWNIEQSNSIQSLTAQAMINNAQFFPGAIIRAPSCVSGPPCPIVAVNQTYANFGEIHAAGLDYALSYRFQAGGVEWTPQASATQLYQYRVALQPGQPATNRVSLANDDSNWAPRWKARLALEARAGPWNGVLAGRYVGSYRDYDPLLNGAYLQLGNIWYADANLRYDFGSLGVPALRNLAAELGAVNLFDQQMQFSNYRSGAVGFDVLQADIRGRFLYFRLQARF
jgi:iron complex outermembrane receptor protein